MASNGLLSPTFEEFAADDVECAGCGEEIRPRFAVDGECPGCHYGGGR